MSQHILAGLRGIVLMVILLGLINKFDARPMNKQDSDVELYQGDIIMTPGIKEALNRSKNDSIVLLPPGPYSPPPPQASSISSRVKRAVVADTSDLKWPAVNGIVTVPYVIEDSSMAAEDVITQAMQHWTDNVPCVRFVPRYEQINYLSFFSGKTCYSSVGRIGRRQRISIGSDCRTLGIVAHEIAHALGFWHEQSRPDRDHYVRVLKDNIQPGKEDEFKKILGGALDSRDVPYDLRSLMHFGPHAFAKARGLNTLETLDGGVDFGQRIGLSEKDIEQAKILYCNSGCAYEDKNKDCPWYKTQGYCQADSSYKQYMDNNCQRTCLCQVCEDKHENCEVYAQESWCSTDNEEYKSFMEIHCKKSCELCTNMDSVPSHGGVVSANKLSPPTAGSTVD